MAKKKKARKNDPLIGTEIDGYEVEEEVGRGAINTVYRIVDTDLPNSPVAMVVVEQDEAQILKAYAEVMDELSGCSEIANVMRFEPGTGTPDDFPRLYMEFLKGGTIKNWIDEVKKEDGRLVIPYKHAVKRVVGALKGLSFAHEKGIEHRDIRPSNIMMDGDRTVLIDFNLTEKVEKMILEHRKGKKKRKGRDREDIGSIQSFSRSEYADEPVKEGQFVRCGRANLSLIGGRNVLGRTQGYLSQEQIEAEMTGDASGIDHRTDIYSMGAVLYEMIGGIQPVLAGNKKLSKLTKEKLPPELDAIVAKALSPKDERYRNVDEFRQDLEKVLRGEFDVPPLYKRAAWGVGRTIAKPFRFAGRVIEGVYDLGSTWLDEIKDWTWDHIAPIIATTAVVSVLGLAVWLGETSISAQSDLRDYLKNSNAIVAYANDDQVGFITTKAVGSGNSMHPKFNTPAKDIQWMRWSPDGKSLLLLDEPGRWYNQNTAAYVFEVKDGSATKILDIEKDDEYEHISEAYWKKDSNMIYLKIDGAMYQITPSGEEFKKISFAQGMRTPAFMDITPQNQSLDGNVKVYENTDGNLAFKQGKVGNIQVTGFDVEVVAWHNPDKAQTNQNK